MPPQVASLAGVRHLSAKTSACREQIRVFRVVPWKPHGALVARTTLFPDETSKFFLVLSFLGPFKVQCESDVSKIQVLASFFCEFCCAALDGGKHQENNNEGTFSHLPLHLCSVTIRRKLSAQNGLSASTGLVLSYPEVWACPEERTLELCHLTTGTF